MTTRPPPVHVVAKRALSIWLVGLAVLTLPGPGFAGHAAPDFVEGFESSLSEWEVEGGTVRRACLASVSLAGCYAEVLPRYRTYTRLIKDVSLPIQDGVVLETAVRFSELSGSSQGYVQLWFDDGSQVSVRLTDDAASGYTKWSLGGTTGQTAPFFQVPDLAWYHLTLIVDPDSRRAKAFVRSVDGVALAASEELAIGPAVAKVTALRFIAVSWSGDDRFYRFDSVRLGHQDHVPKFFMPGTVFRHESIRLTDVSYQNEGIVSRSWDLGDGRTADARTVDVAYALEGHPTVCLMITWRDGRNGTTCRELTVRAPAAAILQLPATSLRNTSIVAAAGPDWPSGVTGLSWSVDGVELATSSYLTTSFDRLGTHTVCLNVTWIGPQHHRGCQDIEIVNAPPSISLTRPVDPQVMLPQRFTAHASDRDGSVVALTWTWSDGLVTTGNATNRTFDDPGWHEVTLSATDDHGATATTAARFFVRDGRPVADFYASGWQQETGEFVNIGPIRFVDGSRDRIGSLTEWHWDLGDGRTSTERNPRVWFPQVGKFIVTLTVVDDDGLANRTSRTIEVTSPMKSSVATLVRIPQWSATFAADSRGRDNHRAATAVGAGGTDSAQVAGGAATAEVAYGLARANVSFARATLAVGGADLQVHGVLLRQVSATPTDRTAPIISRSWLTVGAIYYGGVPLIDPGTIGPNTVVEPAPGIKIYLNTQASDDVGMTTQAVRVTAPGLDVILGETRTEVEGPF